MMKARFVIWVALIVFSTAGCQSFAPVISPTPSLAASNTPLSTSTSIPSPISTPTPLMDHSALISQGKLSCSALDTFTKCIDDVLGMEFEYPTTWGEIEAVLRTGGYSGYTYDYYYGGKTITETEPLVAGGRSKDFSEGRGGMSTDFAGYGEAGLQFKKACDTKWQDMFPICQKVSPKVAWMIRFPNANYICNSAPGFYTTLVFRIEVDLPNNEKINGFVFEAPFLSEQLSNKVKNDLYPLLDIDTNMMPHKCREADKQAFDTQLLSFIEKVKNQNVDSETRSNLDELIHLATSIRFP